MDAKQIHEAIDALAEMGDPDSMKVLNLVERLLADDWTGTGVYETLDSALTMVEQGSHIDYTLNAIMPKE